MNKRVSREEVMALLERTNAATSSVEWFKNRTDSKLAVVGYEIPPYVSGLCQSYLALLDEREAMAERVAELETALEEVRFLIESLDPQINAIVDGDGTITGYRMNTGIWHRLLSMVRGGSVSMALDREIAATNGSVE